MDSSIDAGGEEISAVPASCMCWGNYVSVHMGENNDKNVESWSSNVNIFLSELWRVIKLSYLIKGITRAKRRRSYITLTIERMSWQNRVQNSRVSWHLPLRVIGSQDVESQTKSSKTCSL